MIITYQNRASLLFEHLLSMIFIMILIFILFINIKTFNIIKSKTYNERSIVNVINSLDKIGREISFSKMKKIKENNIILDSIIIEINRNNILVKKRGSINKFKILSDIDIDYKIINNLLILEINYKNKKIYRIISIR